MAAIKLTRFAVQFLAQALLNELIDLLERIRRWWLQRVLKRRH